jgi:uncharacterized protein (DUF302 family)
MKNLITALLLLVIFSLTVSAQEAGKDVVLENKSKLGFEETVKYITEKAGEKGWKVPVVHDLKKAVGKAGYDVKPVNVIEICNPHFASKILEEDKSRVITPMMPLRISVYEIENGDVVIARFNPDMVSKMFGDVAGETLLQACATSEEIVKDIIR